MDNTGPSSADGKRVTFRRTSNRETPYVADLESSGTRLSNPRPLTNSQGNEFPTRWTADSKAVIVHSIGNRPYTILKLPVDGNAPLLLAQSDKGIANNTISPDGGWAIYQAVSKEEEVTGMIVPDSSVNLQLMRVTMTGGPPQWILTARLYGPARCARSPASLCAIAEQSTDRKQLIFTAFDPVRGRGRELTRFDIDPNASYGWDLSPDGTRIAVIKVFTRARRIDILPLNGQSTEVVMVKGWDIVGGIDWAVDGKGLYVQSQTKQAGAALLHVDLQGNVHKLWEETNPGVPVWGLPSPDGHLLTFPHFTVDSNIWMMENF
jgi:Tol biopolymer transport system component